MIQKLFRIKFSFWYLAFALLFLCFAYLIWSKFSYQLAGIDIGFGYSDNQENWRVLEDFIKNKIFFKDYYYEYGWFTLLLQAPVYLFFGKTFLGLTVSRFIFLPLLSVLLILAFARQTLQKKHYIILFLFFILLHQVVTDVSSIRHVIAEVSIGFLIIYLGKNERKYALFSGILAGLTILTSLEYGIALNLTILVLFFLTLIFSNKLIQLFSVFFLLGEFFVILPFALYLLINGALINYLDFTLAIINNFYGKSPCARDVFPRFSEITNLIPYSKLIVFKYPVEFLQRLNFYFVPLAYFLAFLLFVARLVKFKKISPTDFIYLSVAIYGSFIFIRTLDTPCIGFSRYGLVPLFLLLTYFIQWNVSNIRKNKAILNKILSIFTITIIIIWVIITEQTGYLAEFLSKRDDSLPAKIPEQIEQKKYLASAGWHLSKSYVDAYEEVKKYLKKYSNEKDLLFNYPWGPFNNLTSLEAPESIQYSLARAAGDEYLEKLIDELERKKPKFAVVYLINNLGIAKLGTSIEGLGPAGRYYSAGIKEGPVFSGIGDKVQKYILENYKAVFNNKVSIVMVRRNKAIFLENKFIKVQKITNFNKENMRQVKSTYEIKFQKLIQASDLQIKFRIPANFLTKHLSRYFVNFFVKIKGEKYNLNPDLNPLATRTWQSEWISLSDIKNIESLKIEISPSVGFAWWMNPRSIEIESINFYKWQEYQK